MATVIRIIKYEGDADKIRANLAISKPEGVHNFPGYDITIATYMTDLPPAVALPGGAVEATFTAQERVAELENEILEAGEYD